LNDVSAVAQFIINYCELPKGQINGAA